MTQSVYIYKLNLGNDNDEYDTIHDGDLVYSYYCSRNLSDKEIDNVSLAMRNYVLENDDWETDEVYDVGFNYLKEIGVISDIEVFYGGDIPSPEDW